MWKGKERYSSLSARDIITNIFEILSNKDELIKIEYEKEDGSIKTKIVRIASYKIGDETFYSAVTGTPEGTRMEDIGPLEKINRITLLDGNIPVYPVARNGFLLCHTCYLYVEDTCLHIGTEKDTCIYRSSIA